jgi:type I restriction-modification system DNA methylase subunit/predicted type IV restriction endonuclease
MNPPKAVLDLVEHFRRNAVDLRSNRYNETELRREFLDPFFEALGWDVNNHLRYSETYKDVVHEPTRETEQGIPDYCFRIGGTPKFFLEAKKPSVRLKDNPDPALQLRRYAWSSKLPLSILSNFDELAIYDCRIAPKQGDKASTGRISYYSFEEYQQKWEEIASRFSKEAVLQGSFDRFAISSKAKRGTTEVDAAFLTDIEEWRHDLAANIAVRNPGLGQREVNFAVQRTIDRIIFLRICEDRGLESYGQLRALTERPGIYPQLCDLFQLADKRYNSGLFHFHQEKERNESPDTLTPDITIDDVRLKPILKKLYYPESPYAFSHVPADILGQVYEQFLGKVIRITPARQVKIETKPEVLKAGGVYYTPTYIVDYIVKNTVGKLLEGKSPKQVTRIRVLDPACGSGSFLIGAYQYLLNWYRDRYMEEGQKKHKNEIVPDAMGNWRLTLSEKKKILTRHIFGVDIDSQAVEVTKLSLLLKVLETETQLKLFHERALPDLGSNIKCGNSLIGPDFYENQQMLLLDDDGRYRINVFNWKQGFQLAMKEGGFDAIIGNPPYGASLTDPETEYLRSSYKVVNNELDTYALFMEKAISIAKPGSPISMIVPTGWYSGVKFSRLRQYIAQQSNPQVFVNLPYDIFAAWVDTTIFVLTKRETIAAWPPKGKQTVRIRTFPKRFHIKNSDEIQQNEKVADFARWFKNGRDEYLTYADTAATVLIDKIQTCGQPLAQFADVQRGVTPYNLTETPIHMASVAAFDGTVRRYLLERGPKRYIRFDESLAEPKPKRYFEGPRLLLRELISRQFRLQAVRAEQNFVTNKSMQSVLPLGTLASLDFLLGCINSKLMSWYFLHRSNIAQRDDFPKIVLKETRNLPISVSANSPLWRNQHDRMQIMVGQILNLSSQLQRARTDQERTVLERQIEATDGQIDKLVYELYGLTEEEIAIIESGVRG